MKFFLKEISLFIVISQLLVVSSAVGKSLPILPAVTIFSHGILDTGYNQVQLYARQRRHTINKPYVYFDFDDACEPWLGIKLCKFWHCSFGQDNDVEKLSREYVYTINRFPQKPVVLYGVSRGASVIWSFVAKYQPKQLKALVLESPYDRIQTSLRAAIDHIPALINFGITRYLAGVILRTIACKYKVDTLQPIDVAEKIPLDLPVLIICSLEDRLVPAQSSYALYLALRARGHKHAYILVLSKGKHAKLLQSEQGNLYEIVVHAFYKKFGLSHDVRTEQAEHLLLLCQPSDERAFPTDLEVHADKNEHFFQKNEVIK